MTSKVLEQIQSLESERLRLERRLADDETWLALQALEAGNGAGEGASAAAQAAEVVRLKKVLVANPYYAARLKIVEAVTILRRLGGTGAGPTPEPGLAHGLDPSRSTLVAKQPLGVPLLGELSQCVRPLRPAEIGLSSAATSTSETKVVESELSVIRGITPEIAEALAKHGVTRWSEVAAWTAADVRRFADTLNVGRRISTENWIEQAALLDRKRDESEKAQPKPRPEPRALAVEPAPTPPADPAALAASPEIAAAAVRDPSPIVSKPTEPAVTHPAERAAEAIAPPAPMPSPRDWLAQRRREQARTISTPPASTPPPLPQQADIQPELRTDIRPELQSQPPPLPQAQASQTPPPLPRMQPPPLPPLQPLAPLRPASLAAARLSEPTAQASDDSRQRADFSGGVDAEPPPARVNRPFRRRQPVPVDPPAGMEPSTARTAPSPPERLSAEADVTIVSRAPAGPAITGSGGTGPQPYSAPPSHAASTPAQAASLRRRLRGVNNSEGGAASAAATNPAGHRGGVDEASVKIVRPEEARAGESSAADASKSSGPSVVSRFLSALKGRGTEEH
ncbi:MAG: hypothetical protein ACT4N2_03130 [Hyphomicrobium sp.]